MKLKVWTPPVTEGTLHRCADVSQNVELGFFEMLPADWNSCVLT